MILKDKDGGFTQINESTNEIVLLIGHYTIINSNYEKRTSLPTITIYGLGSCIALILYDQVNHIAGMSHILLPKSRLEASLKYPHKFADTSVHYLIEELIQHGAEKTNIKAAIVGGANIFAHHGCMVGELNIKSVVKALTKLKIKIVKKHLGGNSGRIVKFNTNNYSIRVKLTPENEFKLI